MNLFEIMISCFISFCFGVCVGMIYGYYLSQKKEAKSC
jgi:ABC-type antimicrobial peptide transport system permease subunit